MTQFIRINKKEDKPPKKTKFTHCLTEHSGWEPTYEIPSYYEKIIYLGICVVDGHMFAAYKSGVIAIFKGELGDEFD